MGFTQGVVEVTVDHPLWTIKRQLQVEGQVNLKPSVLYRGYLTNLVNMSTVTALQLTTGSIFRRFFGASDDTPFSSRNMAAAYTAGIASAFFSGPFEQFMTTQQNYSLNPRASIKKGIAIHGYRYPLIGFTATTAREGIFTMGYQVWQKIAKLFILNHLHSTPLTHRQKEWVAHVSGGIAAGTVAGYASHPFDMIKTSQQSSEIKISMWQTSKKIYSRCGLFGFFKGVVPRTGGICSAVCILSYVDGKLRASSSIMQLQLFMESTFG